MPRSPRRVRHAHVEKSNSRTRRNEIFKSPQKAQRGESEEVIFVSREPSSVSSKSKPHSDLSTSAGRSDCSITYGLSGSSGTAATILPSPTATIPKSKHIAEIHKFLLTCVPPMGHFLARFMGLGITSSEFLYSLSSKWTTAERRKLLKMLPPGPQGEQVTELELAALENRFASHALN